MSFEPQPETEMGIKSKSDCDIQRIEKQMQEKTEELKALRAEKKQCIVDKTKYKKVNFTLRELQEKIVLENKHNVNEFLELFVDTSHKVKDVNVTRNHVYEALWILVFLYELDDFNKDYEGARRQFYKSLEGGVGQTKEQVLDGKVNSGSEGGIADIYFEIEEIGDKEDTSKTKVDCNGKSLLAPYCSNREIKVYNKYVWKLFPQQGSKTPFKLQFLICV